MAIAFSGSCHYTTALKPVFSNATQYGLCFLFRLNTYPTGQNLPAVVSATGVSQIPLQIQFFNHDVPQITLKITSTTSVILTTAVLSVGTIYQFALSVNAGAVTWYINAISQLTGTITSPTPTASPGFTLGWSGSSTPAGNYELDEWAMWYGYAPTETDFFDIMTGIDTPLTIGTPASTYYTLDGTVGGTPAINDAALNDSGASGFNMATLTGTASLATYTAPLVWVAPLATTASLGRDLQMVYFNPTLNGPHPIVQAITVVGTNPTFQVNGSPATATGPIWANNAQNVAMAAYFLSATVQPTDTITYSAPYNWFTCGTSPAILASNAPVVQSGGHLETAVGVWSATMPVAPFVPASKTMGIGMNMNWPLSGAPYGPYWMQQNLLHKLPNGWTNAATSTADGFPLSITSAGFCQANFLEDSGGNNVDSQAYSQPQGIYSFLANETAHATPMTVTLYSQYSGINVPTITPVAGSPFAGTVIGGIEYGKLWQWTVTRGVTEPSRDMGLSLRWSTHSGGAGPVTLSQPYTTDSNGVVAQMSLTSPLMDGSAQIPSPNQLQPDSTTVARLTSGNGQTPFIIRAADSTQGFDGDSSVVDYADSQFPSNFSYSPITNQITITAIQFYDVTAFPLVYFWDDWGGKATASAPGSPGPFQATASSFQWSNFSGGSSQWGTFQCVYASTKPLKTGQKISFPGTAPSIPFSNGTSSGSHGLALLANVGYITGPNTFVSTQFLGSAFSPGGQCNAVGVTVTNFVAACGVPDGGTVPKGTHGALCQVLGSNVWFNLPAISNAGYWSSATDELLTYVTDDSLTIAVQLGNEIWSNDSQSQPLFAAFSSLLGIGSNWESAYVYQAGRAKATVQAAVTAAGRSNPVKLIIGGQDTTTGVTQALSAACNAAGVAPDYVGIAPYRNISTDTTIVAASTTLPVGTYLDFLRWYLTYNVAYNSPGAANSEPAQVVAMNGFTVGSSPPLLVGYEAGWQYFYMGNQGPLSHDCHAHPNGYDLITSMLSVFQNNGFHFVNYYCFCLPLDFLSSATMYEWGLYRWHGQPAGRGLSNQFATALGGSPADGKDHTDLNQSPMAQALLDWMDVNVEPLVDSSIPVETFDALWWDAAPFDGMPPVRALPPLSSQRVETFDSFWWDGCTFDGSMMSTSGTQLVANIDPRAIELTTPATPAFTDIDPRAAEATTPATPSWTDIDPRGVQIAGSG